MLVTDLPIWADCPLPVPPEIEVRRGSYDGQDCVALWHPKSRRQATYYDAKQFNAGTIKYGINQLIGGQEKHDASTEQGAEKHKTTIKKMNKPKETA